MGTLIAYGYGTAALFMECSCHDGFGYTVHAPFPSPNECLAWCDVTSRDRYHLETRPTNGYERANLYRPDLPRDDIGS